MTNDSSIINLLGAKFKATNAIVITAIVIVIIAIVILIVVKYKGALTDAIKNRQLADALNEEIDPDTITLTQTQLNTFASSLYAAMKGWGTDEEKIYSVFRSMGSRSDVLQLIKTYGVKDGENLSEWLYDDLTAKEIDKINNILANNNINYQF